MNFFARDPADYVPYAGHLPDMPSVALMLDGTVFAVLEMPGIAFELEAASQRNGRVDILNNTLMQIADDNLVVYSHLVRHADTKPSPVNSGRHSFMALDLYAQYAQHLLTGLRRNTWFLTIMVRPDTARLVLPVGKRKSTQVAPKAAQIRQLEDAVAAVTEVLSDRAPRRLGLRTQATDIPGSPQIFTEIGEALFLIRTAVPMPVPLPSGTLGGAVYSHRVIVGPRSYDLNIPGMTRFGSIATYLNYPKQARPGSLNSLLSAPCDLVLTQSFHFMLNRSAEFKMALKQNQQRNVGSVSATLEKGLMEARDALAAGLIAKGMHHLSCAIYGDTLDSLDTNTGIVMRRLVEHGGAIPMREGRMGLEAAYFAQLPGVLTWRTRPGRLDTLAFAAMSSFEGFPAGNSSGYWGKPIARFRTRGGTAYDLIPHVDDVGHMLMLGRSGKGKTLLANFLMTCLEPSMGDDGIRLIIDKDAGAKLMVELSGGRYLHLRRGRDSGLAPLRGLVDGPETRSFLLQTFRGLILRDGLGPIDPDEEARMARGIDAQMDMPPAFRSMAGVHEFMGSAQNGAGDRFAKWCRGGEMGWVLDNDEHLVDFNAPVAARIYGFDFTELMPKDEGMADDGACAAAAAVIVHQMRGMMDGRRIACFFDECRFYLDVLGRVIEDFALTGRKNELMCWMAAQEPKHFTDSPVGRSLIGQAATKIAFPDASADTAAYVRDLKFSEPAAEQVRVGMGNGRRFLVWRDDGPAICEFDLSAMPAAVATLSGRAGNVRMLDGIAPEASAEDRYRIFRNQHQRERTPA